MRVVWHSMLLSRRRWGMRCSRPSAPSQDCCVRRHGEFRALYSRKQPESTCQGLQPASPDLEHRHSVGFGMQCLASSAEAGALLAAKHPVMGLLRMQA